MGIKKYLKFFAVFLAAVICMFSFENVKFDKAVKTAAYNIGSRGTRIEQIQRRLAEYGYYTGNIDGIYGQSTYNAVRNFQQNNSLTPDGIVGDATLSAMGLFFTMGEITDEERELWARVIYGEGRGEPDGGPVAGGAGV